MSLRIEDYALIGDGSTAALVGRNGSIDWLAFPRFDSAACFAALLGTKENGRWLIAPCAANVQVKRRYRPATLVLETEFSTSEGTVVLTDCMDHRNDRHDLYRMVRGVRGRVSMQMELVIRYEYGSVVPWVTRMDDGSLRAVAGPEQLTLATPAPLHGENLKTFSEFTVSEGQEIPFCLGWSPSSQKPHPPRNVSDAIEHVAHSWEHWAKAHKATGPWAEPVLRSLITLKALTHHATGGIVAAPTTSLPEQLGGQRNWDYRFCWLRDSTFTLYALLQAGFYDEAKAWREWLLRAVAGSPSQMQIMYGVAGERRLTEYEVGWLAGYENSSPVRIGNAASEQLQLDVYGEVLDSLYQARRKGLTGLEAAWNLEKALVKHLETIWQEPDEGIWEVRGGRQHFTYSKVMAWVALDRAVRTVQEFGAEGPLDRWIKLRDQIHAEVCRCGFDREIGSFVQYFGSKELDASLLLIPLVGFLSPDDPKVRGTVAAIEKHLVVDGFVARYNTRSSVDGLPGDEGVFLACSFWLADNYVLQHRYDDARELFERLLTLRNDVGLLSEEYDPKTRRQLGNFPQALSHLALVNTAYNLASEQKPAKDRAAR